MLNYIHVKLQVGPDVVHLNGNVKQMYVTRYWRIIVDALARQGVAKIQVSDWSWKKTSQERCTQRTLWQLIVNIYVYIRRLISELYDIWCPWNNQSKLLGTHYKLFSLLHIAFLDIAKEPPLFNRGAGHTPTSIQAVTGFARAVRRRPSSPAQQLDWNGLQMNTTEQSYYTNTGGIIVI